MTPDRFRLLLDAYGADPQLWPAAERTEAAAFAASLDGHAGWSEAVELDRMLASHRVDPPDSALYRAILANAPAPQALWRRARFWWSGCALAGCGAAGVLAGALLVSMIVSTLMPPASVQSGNGAYTTSIFSDLFADGTTDE